MTCSINCNMWGVVHKTFTRAVDEAEKMSEEATWFKHGNLSSVTPGYTLPLCLHYWSQHRRLSSARSSHNANMFLSAGYIASANRHWCSGAGGGDKVVQDPSTGRHLGLSEEWKSVSKRHSSKPQPAERLCATVHCSSRQLHSKPCTLISHDAVLFCSL